MDVGAPACPPSPSFSCLPRLSGHGRGVTPGRSDLAARRAAAARVVGSPGRRDRGAPRSARAVTGTHPTRATVSPHRGKGQGMMVCTKKKKQSAMPGVHARRANACPRLAGLRWHGEAGTDPPPSRQAAWLAPARRGAGPCTPRSTRRRDRRDTHGSVTQRHGRGPPSRAAAETVVVHMTVSWTEGTHPAERWGGQLRSTKRGGAVRRGRVGRHAPHGD